MKTLKVWGGNLDGRARGLLQYHGAGPGRWAGRLFQPHNFPRGALDDLDAGRNELGNPVTKKVPIANIVAAIMTGDHEWVQAVIGDPIEHSKSPLIQGFWLDKLGIGYAAVAALIGAQPSEIVFTSGMGIVNQIKRMNAADRAALPMHVMLSQVPSGKGNPTHVLEPVEIGG